MAVSIHQKATYPMTQFHKKEHTTMKQTNKHGVRILITLAVRVGGRELNFLQMRKNPRFSNNQAEKKKQLM